VTPAPITTTRLSMAWQHRSGHEPDARETMTSLLTVGHGTLSPEAFQAMLRDAGVERIVDIRRFPGSRRHPHFNRDALERSLPAVEIDYVWLEPLGGRRKASPTSPNVALRNDAFRGYADHMQTPEFVHGVHELITLTHDGRLTAVLCSESLWWRCHRRLLADHLTLVAGMDVSHLLHDGRRTPHPPTDGVRRLGNSVRYDAAASPSPSRA
jgi:uncharacterized protein (DUF488 family)